MEAVANNTDRELIRSELGPKRGIVPMDGRGTAVAPVSVECRTGGRCSIDVLRRAVRVTDRDDHVCLGSVSDELDRARQLGSKRHDANASTCGSLQILKLIDSWRVHPRRIVRAVGRTGREIGALQMVTGRTERKVRHVSTRRLQDLEVSMQAFH